METNASRPVLGPTSTNASRKRAQDDASDGASGQPTSKRVSTGSTTPASAATQRKPAAKPIRVIEQQPDWAFDVVGTWQIDATHISCDFRSRYLPESKQPPVEPYTLEVRYANNANSWVNGRQLWATFKWGDWTGCIRMCPGHRYRYSHDQFYDESELSKGVWPGEEPLGTPVWNFRWKAQTAGPDKAFYDKGIIDGTDEYETQLRFSKDEDGTTKIDGKMVAGGYKARKFSGVKISDHVSDVTAMGKLNNVGALWKKLSTPHEESRFEICRRCKGKMEDSDESDSEFELPSEEDWEAERKKHEAKREAEAAKEKAEEEAPWPTPMTGTWNITPWNSRDMDADRPDTVRFMHIQETCRTDGSGSGRQYWAMFQFGRDWSGLMRLCPLPALSKEWASDSITGKAFEKACVVEEGVYPGPSPHGVNRWLIKWRGPLDVSPDAVSGGHKDARPTDEITLDLFVKVGEDGFLTLSGGTRKGSSVNFFEGVRTGDFSPTHDGPSLEKLWKQLAFMQPVKPKCFKWHSVLPENPIQKPPKWAWDVLGIWKVSAPGFAEAFEIDKNAILVLEIRMDNDKDNAKPSVGRQLWATFNFYSDHHYTTMLNGSGCMRFRPLPENSRPCVDVESFEKACRLKGGVWPGHVRSANGKSFQKWGCRWRGAWTDVEKDEAHVIPSTDMYETRLDFERDDDGKLKIRGLLALNFRYIRMTGVKDENARRASRDEDYAVRHWDAFGRW